MSTKKQWTGREKLTIVRERQKGECQVSRYVEDRGAVYSPIPACG